MISLRTLGLSLLAISLLNVGNVAFAEQTIFQYDESRLTNLYDAYLKKHQSDSYLEKRIVEERARVRTAAADEVKQITAPAANMDITDTTVLPKALDQQRSTVATLEEQLHVHSVDLSLLKDEEERYYLSPGSATGSNTDASRLTKNYPELLAKRAILEERVAAIDDALPLQKSRQTGLERERLFDQFAFLFSFFSYVGIILIGAIIERTMRRMIIGRIEEKGRRYLLSKMLTATIYSIITLWIVSKIFSDHPNALASLAIVGAGLAVALQDVVKDLVGWMMIAQRRLFTLGDRICIGNHTGDVIDIGLMRTAMLEVSVAGPFTAHERTGKTLYVPNSLLLKEALLNYNTTSDFMSVEMQVTVSYESDWKKAENILKEALTKETSAFAEQARQQQRKRTALFYTAWEVSEPEVHIDLAESGILFTLKFTVPIGKRRTVVSNLSRAILEQFGAQYDVNLAFNTIRIIGEKSDLLPK